MAENPPRITPPQGNPGRTSLDEGLYVFRVVLLAGPALIMAWQAIRLAVPIIAAIPLAYLVGQSWCAWAYHKGRSPKIIMVANYFSILAALVPMAPVAALLLSPSATQVVLNYLWSSPLLVPLTVVWILIELPIETVFSLFYARRSGRRLSIMAEASAA